MRLASLTLIGLILITGCQSPSTPPSTPSSMPSPSSPSSPSMPSPPSPSAPSMPSPSSPSAPSMPSPSSPSSPSMPSSSSPSMPSPSSANDAGKTQTAGESGSTGAKGASADPTQDQTGAAGKKLTQVGKALSSAASDSDAPPRSASAGDDSQQDQTQC